MPAFWCQHLPSHAKVWFPAWLNTSNATNMLEYKLTQAPSVHCVKFQAMHGTPCVPCVAWNFLRNTYAVHSSYATQAHACDACGITCDSCVALNLTHTMQAMQPRFLRMFLHSTCNATHTNEANIAWNLMQVIVIISLVTVTEFSPPPRWLAITEPTPPPRRYIVLGGLSWRCFL